MCKSEILRTGHTVCGKNSVEWAQTAMPFSEGSPVFKHTRRVLTLSIDFCGGLAVLAVYLLSCSQTF
jgi:hypothetical protein